MSDDSCFTKDPLQQKSEEIQEIFNAFSPQDKNAIIPLLQSIQSHFGYLPQQSIALASWYLSIPITKVYSIITFSDHLRLEPKGKIHIEVCIGAGCYVKGGAELLQVLEAELGIKNGETTKDLLYSLNTVSCLGACGLAPAIKINHHIYGKLEPKDILRLLKEYAMRGG